MSLPLKKIVIDAGHGGKDTGAYNRKYGTKEKNINLAIALELSQALEKKGKYEVYLTRKEDRFIPLHGRSSFANGIGADLFISIHCNAGRRKEDGFEIYFLSEKATDPDAEDLAELENASHAFEEKDSHGDEKLMGLLSSMARNEYINESSLLCHTIEEAVKKELSLSSRGVKQANFHVLHGVQMPSVLVETAFITNRKDEKKLRSKSFRSNMVKAIVLGIENYENRVSSLQPTQ